MISGSGPAIFAMTDNEQEAEDIYQVLSKKYFQVYVVKTF